MRDPRLGMVGFVVACLLAPVLNAQVSDRAAGTWEVDVAKSTYSPGPPPKNQVRTYEVTGDTVKYTAKGFDGDGKPTLIQYTAKFDGKDHPFTGSPDYDAISIRMIDASTVDFTLKKAGKALAEGRRIVSKDGKSMTVTQKGTNANGQAISSVVVLNRK